MPPGLSFLLIPVYFTLKLVTVVVPTEYLNRLNQFAKEKIPASEGGMGQHNQHRFMLIMLIIFGFFMLTLPVTLLVATRFLNIFAQIELPRPHFYIWFLFAGTLYGAYGNSLWHTYLCSSIVFLAFHHFLLRPAEVAPRLQDFLMAIMLGTVPSMDYPALVYCLLLLGMIAVSKRKMPFSYFLVILGGFLIFPLLTLVYHNLAFGHPLHTSYQFRAARGLMSILQKDVGEQGMMALLPSNEKFMRALFDLKCGVLFYNPLFILVLESIVRSPLEQLKNLVRNPDRLCALLIIMANFVYFISLPGNVHPSAGSYGARYMLYSVPLCFWWLLPWFKKLEENKSRLPIFIFLYSILFYIPFWMYGSPQLNLMEFFQTLYRLGPGNYTLTKLSQIRSLVPILPGMILYGVVLTMLCFFNRLALKKTRSEAHERVLNQKIGQ
jgi:hypothetical protein